MRQPDATDTQVSAREAEVLSALGEHLTNAEIAAKLFISIRTVESHVSSLLRKLGAADRRALAASAAQRSRQPAFADAPAWPSPLTSFVGRSAERDGLAAALREHRLVTVVGAGGVGKTRVALAATDDARAQFRDGGWYVDLVPVADESMIAATVAAAVGLGEQQGRESQDAVLAWAADRHALLVLDNCEHVIDGVGAVVERLLARAPGLRVLATSRSRLMLPFEYVFAVEGLSDDDADELFAGRARSTGVVLTDSDLPRVRHICRHLDGMPLAIELAAARVPAMGLDGVESGLTDHLVLLTGARRADERHRSLRSTLDWSYTLLDERARAVLRRVAVFTGPFHTGAAVAVTAEPAAATDMRAELAALADHSLLATVLSADGTRYSVLETIRQYGLERLADAGEADRTRERHLRWCVGDMTELLERDELTAAWRASFDRLADELRMALSWAATARADGAYQAASVLAAGCHRRGMPAEAQQRSEQAATLAPTDEQAVTALRLAAGSARARLAGDDALRLHLAAAAAAQRAGEPEHGARDLAHAAELAARSAGILTDPPSTDTVLGWLDEAGHRGGDDRTTMGWAAAAKAFSGADDEPGTATLVAHALEVARTTGDVLLESAALDRQTTLRLAHGDFRPGLANATRRTELLAAERPGAEQGFELSDAYAMAADAALGAGELRLARSAAERSRELPFHREVGHVPASRLVVIASLAGDWDDAVALGGFFRESWERAGSPRVPSLRRAAHAAAMVHGCLGDDDARERWLAVAADLSSLVPRAGDHRIVERVFDAIRLLHLNRPDQALDCLEIHPHEFRGWYELIWQPWYAALWAESAVLAGHDGAADRIRLARPLVAGNVVAVALVDRAEALASSDRDGVRAAAAALDAAGCRYQWSRSLALAER